MFSLVSSLAFTPLYVLVTRTDVMYVGVDVPATVVEDGCVDAGAFCEAVEMRTIERHFKQTSGTSIVFIE
jgi:hypothetical protein